MSARFRSVLLTVVLVGGAASMPLAQQPAAVPAPSVPIVTKPEPAQRPAATPVRIDIVLSRTKGGAQLSSLPYSLHATSDGRASLRLGSNVPIPNGGGGAAVTSITYQSVGSNIDCGLSPMPDGRYRLELTMEDSSVAASENPVPAIGAPVLRSYRISTTLILRDAQSSTFNVATDKVSGETIQAQVTVTAIK